LKFNQTESGSVSPGYGRNHPCYSFLAGNRQKSNKPAEKSMDEQAWAGGMMDAGGKLG
jgi:hypothetical protein